MAIKKILFKKENWRIHIDKAPNKNSYPTVFISKKNSIKYEVVGIIYNTNNEFILRYNKNLEKITLDLDSEDWHELKEIDIFSIFHDKIKNLKKEYDKYLFLFKFLN